MRIQLSTLLLSAAMLSVGVSLSPLSLAADDWPFTHIKPVTDTDFYDKVLSADSAADDETNLGSAIVIMCPTDCQSVDKLVDDNASGGQFFDYSKLHIYRMVNPRLREPTIFVMGQRGHNYYDHEGRPFKPTADNIGDVIKYLAAIVDGFKHFTGSRLEQDELDRILDGNPPTRPSNQPPIRTVPPLEAAPNIAAPEDCENCLNQ